MKLLVIIVTYNGSKWLDKCLSSVVNSTVNADAFIVDNGSTDGTVEFIKENYPEAKLIVSPENLGFGKANNIGLKYAIDNNYDYVYLLNQDAWVDNNVFEKLIDIKKNNPEFGIISPLQINAEQTKLDLNFNYCCPRVMISDACCNRLSPLYEVDKVMAAHWLISRDCILKIGGFSPVFPHYGEDDNFIDRAKFKKIKIGIATTVKGVHDREWRQSTKRHNIYRNKMHILVILSNPALNKKKRVNDCLKYCCKAMLSYRSIVPLINMLKLLCRYPQIRSSRINSINPLAFLNK